MSDYLLEIGTEELPARLTEGILTELQEKSASMLQGKRVAFEGLDTYSTPRRLVLYVQGIALTQAELLEEIKGPSKKVSFDQSGVPTKAGQGFARGQGVAVDDLIVQETAAGEYVFARRRIAGRPTAEVLSEQVPALIAGLNFPRPMRWGERELKFIRPIHWLLSLLDQNTVDFDLEGLHPGRVTYGLRNFSPEPLEITHPSEYFDKLKSVNVLVDQKQRQKLIWEMTHKAAASVRGVVHPDPELLSEITHLVEYPTPLCGSFDVRFLKLPPEVVITPMREHQRYFPVWNDKGKLLPKFVAFANGPVSNRTLITEGNEKVLRARLQDAEFFYEEDLKTNLDEKVEKLKKIVFLEGLGTIFNKTERLVRVGRQLAEILKLTENQRQAAERAAYLSKADLVTNMVCEFPELQGVMGGAYAQAEEEKRDVCLAIREHYQPRFAGDQPPANKVGAVVAIADKVDNLVGCFAMGLEPSGSQDPFALRRQALGICNIALEHELLFSLTELIASSYDSFGAVKFKISLPDVQGRLGEFFRARLRNFFIDQGFSYDTVEAVLTADYDCIADVRGRLQAVESLRQRSEFVELLTAYTRASNLARQAAGLDIDPAIFSEDGEKVLYDSWVGLKKEIRTATHKRDFTAALRKGAEVVGPIDRFFTEVMVMVDDTAMRNNRLALLKDIAETLGSLADLSKIAK